MEELEDQSVVSLYDKCTLSEAESAIQFGRHTDLEDQSIFGERASDLDSENVYFNGKSSSSEDENILSCQDDHANEIIDQQVVEEKLIVVDSDTDIVESWTFDDDNSLVDFLATRYIDPTLIDLEEGIKNSLNHLENFLSGDFLNRSTRICTVSLDTKNVVTR